MTKVIQKLKTYKLYICLLLFFMLALPYVFPVFRFGTLPGYIIRGVSFFILLFYSIFLLDFNSLVKNKNLLIIVSLIIIFSFVSLLINLINFSDKSIIFSSLGLIFANSLVILITFDLFNCENIQKNYVILIVNLFTIFLLIYSLIFDIRDIFYSFTNFDHSNYDTTSIFTDKNVFGYFLVFDSMINIDMSKSNKKHINILMIFLCLIFSFISRTKTSFVIILVLLITQFVNIIKNSKKSTKIILLLLASCSILTIFLLVFLKTGVFSKVYDFIFDKYGLFYDGKVVLQYRLNNWKKILNILVKNPLNIAFGFGERIAFNTINFPVDNAIIFLLITGGSFKLITYSLLFILWSKKVWDIKLLPFFIAIMLYGLMQNYLLFTCNFASIGYLIIFAINYKRS